MVETTSSDAGLRSTVEQAARWASRAAEELEPESTGDAVGPPGTGDDAVDQAVAALGRLEGAPLREHLDVVDGIHRVLLDRLADTES